MLPLTRAVQRSKATENRLVFLHGWEGREVQEGRGATPQGLSWDRGNVRLPRLKSIPKATGWYTVPRELYYM